jgi:integrase
METKDFSFTEIKKAFEEYLLSLKYSPSTAETYRWSLSRLERFMADVGETAYSPEIGISLIKKELEDAVYSTSHLRLTKLIIRRLDDFLNGEFNLLPVKENSVSDCYIGYLQNFLDNLRLQGLRNSTVKEYYYSGTKILRAFYLHEVYDLSKIQPQDIYDVFAESNDKANISRTLKSFLRYLFKSGVLAHDFSIFVPSVRKRKPIPSVYTKEETKQLLSSIDNEESTGKRNYAIILLALRLGVRSGDITNLQILDIDFQSNTIEFAQKKTGVLQRLEFIPEVKEAIHQYLFKCRPETSCPNLFVSIRPPFRPLTVMAVTSIITRCMKRAGIAAGSRKRGGHALRMTFASELVSEKVPYEVVRKILGHEDTKSMKHYVKFDVEMLRSCALEIPPLGGLYAEYVNNCMGGRKK